MYMLSGTIAENRGVMQTQVIQWMTKAGKIKAPFSENCESLTSHNANAALKISNVVFS